MPPGLDAGGQDRVQEDGVDLGRQAGGIEGAATADPYTERPHCSLVTNREFRS
jgi:hypothetical protein